jgi:hypothetical protein
VIQGGSNDIYRNNSEAALMQIMKFCKNVNNTNIIVADIPSRYDLVKNSIVNKEIQVFNRKLSKVTKQLKHVTILEPRLNREMVTQHGLHLNRLGKCLIAKQIAMEIYGLTEEKVNKIISLNWKLETRVNSETIITSSTGYDNIEEQQNHPTSSKETYFEHKDTLTRRYPTRSGKLPTSRRGGFL